MSVNEQVRNPCKQTGQQRVHKSRDTKFILYIWIPRKRRLHRLTIFELLCKCFEYFFFQAQNIPLCLEKLAHRCHECNVLTDPLNLSALALPTCTQCVSIFNCSGPAELKRTSEYACASCTVSHVFNAKRVGNYLSPSSAMFGTQNPCTLASSPRRSVKSDWTYLKDRASSAPGRDGTARPASFDKWKVALEFRPFP